MIEVDESPHEATQPLTEAPGLANIMAAGATMPAFEMSPDKVGEEPHEQYDRNWAAAPSFPPTPPGTPARLAPKQRIDSGETGRPLAQPIARRGKGEGEGEASRRATRSSASSAKQVTSDDAAKGRFRSSGSGQGEPGAPPGGEPAGSSGAGDRRGDPPTSAC